MFKNYFKTAIRSLAKNKAFSLINIIGLAVSMAVCLLIINIIAEQKSYDTFHSKKERIYRVMTMGAGGSFTTATAAYPLAQKLKQEYPGIEQTATLVRNIGGDMLYNEKAASGGGYFADGQLFKVFDYKLSKGDAATALKNPFSLVVSEKIAKLLFGNEEPIGRQVQFNDKGISAGTPEKGNHETAYGLFTITGVLAEVKGKTHLPFQLLASLSTLPALVADKKIDFDANNWNGVWDNYTYVLLDKTNNVKTLDAALVQIASKQYVKGSNNEYTFQSKALLDIIGGNPHGNETTVYLPGVVILVLSVLGLIVMLSACLNYTNLSVARSLSRTREVGIRKVTGATRTQVFLQFIVEAVIISLLAFVLAVALLYFLKQAFTGLWFNQFMQLELSQNLQLYLLFIGFSIIIGIIAGLLPSVYISAFNPLAMIRNSGTVKGMKGVVLRKALLVLQFTVSIVFIVSTVVLFQQTQHVFNFDYGFNKDNVVNVSIYKQENYQRFAQAVSQNKKVKAVAACSFMPATGTQNGTRIYKAAPAADSLQTSTIDGDAKFFEVLNVPLIAGKTFPDIVDTSGEDYIVVNEKLVQAFKYNSPAGAIGEKLMIDGNTVEIIGVVKDFQFLDVSRKMEPLVVRNRPETFGVAAVKMQGSETAATLKFLEQTWKSVNPNTKFEYAFFDEQMSFTQSLLRDASKILGTLSFLAVFISCLGLLGMAAYTAQTRAKEISIRKIVGSSVRQIVMLLSKGFLVLLLIATFIALPVAYLLNNMWLQFFASRISISPLVMVLSVLIMFGISLLTVFSQSWRAAFANPIKKLRSE
jgi:putative ABC transport system permease protein